MTKSDQLKTNLKIAFVSDGIYQFNKGGKEKRLFDITKRLASSGYAIHVYTMNWWGAKSSKDVLVDHGVVFHPICPYIPLYSGSRRSIVQGIVFGLTCFKLMLEDFDVLDVDHMPYFPIFSSKIVCMLKRKSLVGTWHEVWGYKYWNRYLGMLGVIPFIMERFMVFLPDKIVSVSQMTSNHLFKMSKRLNVSTIGIGTDVDEIAKIKGSKQTADIIFSGRLLKHKNVDMLIDAVAILKQEYPSIKCTITGDGPEIEALTKQVTQLKLTKNVKLTGFIKNHDDLLSMIKSSKVFVLPSEREGFGIAIIEANACSTPAITIESENNASKFLINTGVNGYVTKGNAKDLAGAIKKAFQNEPSLRRSSVKEAMKYSWNNILYSLEKVYIKYAAQ